MFTMRWLCCFILLLLVMGAGVTAIDPIPLSDSELAGVVAAGFNVTIDFGVDVKAPPNSLLIQQDQLDALKDFATTHLQHASVTGGIDAAPSVDTGGINLPNLQTLVNNNINISDNALQNSRSLLNIIALGDVAVGMNLTIIVNPGDTPFNVTQTNINWSDLISSLLPTPSAN